MASPFAVFRKHERVMMAVVGVLAMVAFVFLPPLLENNGSRGSAQDPVVAETKLYGDIHETDLQRMRAARALANRFVAATLAAGIGYQVEAPFGPDSERSVVETMVLTRKAEQLGMRVTDEEITRFLQQISNDRVTGAQFAEILQAIGGGRKGGLSRRQVYDALRTELLARHLANIFASNGQTTPAERWDYYQRLNSRAQIEVVPVAVADFIDKIPDPDEAVARAFFESYKDSEPVAGSPLPGFKIPAKVALQYFTADYEQFYDPDAVAYQEIVDYYEKNKSKMFLYSGDFGATPGPTDKDAEAKEPGAEGAAKPDGEEGDKPAATSDEPDAAAKPADATTPPEGATPEGAAPDSAEKKPDEAGKSEKPPKQSSNLRRSLDGELLALADAFPPGDEPAANDTPAAEAKPADATAPADQPAADAAATPAAEGAAAEEKTPIMSIRDEDALPDDITPPRYDPLWKVEPSIRKSLASQRAAEKMGEVLAGVREKMVKYGNERTRWEVKHEQDKSLAPPKELDFDALAKQYNLTAHSTPLLSARELRDIEGIGESRVGEFPLALYAFGQWQLYQAAVSSDSAGNQYLVWKTEQQPARVPEFAEIQAEVVRAWKMIEARKPALERAKELAEAARKENLSLAKLAERDGLQLIKPEPFSWLSDGATPSFNMRVPPRMSEVQGVQDAGNEFMQVVFGQSPGGIGVAFNNPRTVIEVIQVLDFVPGIEVLRRGFMADDFRTYERAAAPQREQQSAFWNRSIQQEAGLNWKRQPDPVRSGSEGA